MKKKPARHPDKSRPTAAAAADGPACVALRCRACGAALTPALRRVPDPRRPTELAGVDLLPRGFFWEAPEGFWPQTEAGAWVVNPADLLGLVPVGDRSGCCGPSGGGGLNLACAGRHRVATEVTDCWAPHMVLFAPSATLSVVVEGEEPRGRVLIAGGSGPILSEEAFAAWAHGALDAADWHGNDVGALVREWLERTEASGETACIVWLEAEASARAGVPVGAIEAAIEQAQQGVARRRVTLRVSSSAPGP